MWLDVNRWALVQWLQSGQRNRRSYERDRMIELTQRHMKGYSHFDAKLELPEAHKLINDPLAVAAHPFLPFIAEEKTHQPFRGNKPPKGKAPKPSKPDKKRRMLMKASRRDVRPSMRLIGAYCSIRTKNSSLSTRYQTR